MFQVSSTYLRFRSRNGFRSAALRLAAAAVLVLWLPLAASAYTVILRGGRRIEIPDNFTVTRSTLTYEAAPGINVTIQMSSIDIEATERANQEATGSLLRRAEQSAESFDSAEKKAAPLRGQAQKTITNQDLAASRRAREESEAAYEKRRRQLGLPSMEETRRRAEEEAQRARAQLGQWQLEEAQAEGYWRARASELRGQMAALDAEISYLRARLFEIPDTLSNSSFTVISSAVPVFPLRPVIGLSPPTVFRQRAAPGIYIAPARGPQLSGRVGFGSGATRGRILINQTPRVGIAGRQFGVRPGPFFSPVTVAAASYPGYLPSYDYERAALLSRLHELEAQRAGLQAHWRLLEDEARRAGAQPGWLRP